MRGCHEPAAAGAWARACRAVQAKAVDVAVYSAVAHATGVALAEAPAAAVTAAGFVAEGD